VGGGQGERDSIASDTKRLILYRDDRVVVINKPSGLAVHRGWDDDPVNALTITRDLCGRYVYPVHRLDRATSGALLFAFDADTTALLNQRGAMHKRYLALTRGIVPEELRIDHPIPRTDKGERVEAITSIRRLATAEDRYSWIEAIPETGRMHQIRRHLKHIFHPLMGDTRYGDGRENRKLRESIGLHRLALHNAELSFFDLTITAPLPDDLRVPLERLGVAFFE
jgi:tRNA pseudouridine65 synthase